MSNEPSRIAARSCGVRPSGTISESAPTWVAGSQRPAKRQPSAASTQSTTFGSRSTSWLAAGLDPALGDPVDPGGQAGDPQDVGRAAFEEVGELRGWVSLAESPPVPPSRQARGWPGGRRRGRRCRSGRTGPCGRGRRGGRSAWPSGRSALPRPTARRRPGTRPRPGGRSGRWPRSAGPCPGRWRRGSARPAGSCRVEGRADVLGVEVAVRRGDPGQRDRRRPSPACGAAG